MDLLSSLSLSLSLCRHTFTFFSITTTGKPRSFGKPILRDLLANTSRDSLQSFSIEKSFLTIEVKASYLVTRTNNARKMKIKHRMSTACRETADGNETEDRDYLERLQTLKKRTVSLRWLSKKLNFHGNATALLRLQLSLS